MLGAQRAFPRHRCRIWGASPVQGIPQNPRKVFGAGGCAAPPAAASLQAQWLIVGPAFMQGQGMAAQGKGRRRSRKVAVGRRSEASAQWEGAGRGKQTAESADCRGGPGTSSTTCSNAWAEGDLRSKCCELAINPLIFWVRPLLSPAGTAGLAEHRSVTFGLQLCPCSHPSP